MALSLLFLIFVNDLPDVISDQLVIYADDINIYSCINSKYWLTGL